MAYQKVYSRINWENEPSKDTPINEENLNKIDYALNEVDSRVVELSGYENVVKGYKDQAEQSALESATSSQNSKTSEDNAKIYMDNASGYATTSQNASTQAQASETNAKSYSDSALASKNSAETSETNAKESEDNAKISEDNAKASEDNAKVSETNAKASEDVALAKASEVTEYANTSKSYAVGTNGVVRENDATDNSKYYSEQAHQEYLNAKEQADRISIATTEKVGTSKPDGTSITIDEDGTIHATSSGSATISDITNDQWESEYKEKQDDVLYEISGYESKGDAWESDNIFFDNSSSNLTSVNVESAIKEVNGKVDDETVVNLIEFPYDTKTVTKKGITFTVNDDGSVTANGTPTVDVAFTFYSRNVNNDLFKRIGKGTFTLSGISGGSSTTYWLQLGYGTSSAYNGTLIYVCDGSKSYTITDDLESYNAQITFTVSSGTTLDNVTVKPMLEVGTVAHDYVPPTSNPKQRLTEQVADTSRTLSNALGSNAWVSTTSYSIGNHVIHNNKLYRCIVACSNQMPPNATYWVEVSLASLNTNFMNLFQDGVSKFNVGVHPEVKEVFFDVYIDSTKYYRCQFSGVSSKMNMFYWNGSSWETLI